MVDTAQSYLHKILAHLPDIKYDGTRTIKSINIKNETQKNKNNLICVSNI